MPLVDVGFSIDDGPVPPEVVEFLDEADSRITQFLRSQRDSTNFVSSDSVTVYQSLRAIAAAQLAPGNVFCEWGSGFGVATSLAAMLEFSAYGIEVERSLVDAAQALADDFGLSAEFVHGSFIPPGAEALVDEAYVECSPDSFRLVTESDRAYHDLGLDSYDFDLVFTYPWPGEESVVQRLFERCAAEGALLLTYGQRLSMRLQRKTAGGSETDRDDGYSVLD